MCLVIGSRLDHIIPNALHCSGVGVGSRGSFWNIKDPAFCCNHYSMLTKHSALNSCQCLRRTHLVKGQ
jgi:hypothetical protein